MTVITRTMPLRGTLDNKNEMKSYRSMVRTTSSSKRLFKAKYNLISNITTPESDIYFWRYFGYHPLRRQFY
jgi:hypothetical protein